MPAFLKRYKIFFQEKLCVKYFLENVRCLRTTCDILFCLRNKGFGVHRGVDFREVSAVVNFDFPPTEKNYTHRVGRTARGGNYGIAISLVNSKEREIFGKIQELKR